MAVQRGLSHNLCNIQGELAHACASELADNPVGGRMGAVHASRDNMRLRGGDSVGRVMAAVGQGRSDRQAHGSRSEWWEYGELSGRKQRLSS